VKRPLAHLPRRLFLLSLLVGAALIAASSLAYFDLDAVPPFVLEKLPLRHETLYLVALRVHVAAALTTLPLSVLLSTRWLQRRVAWHRRLGRVAGILVLFALVPAGAVLAPSARGGWISTAGFLLSGAIMAVAMVVGIQAARRHELASHAHAMRHVLAQMSVAVVSRAALVAVGAAGIDGDLAYVLALWIPVVASAALVELLASVRSSASWKGSPMKSRPWFVPSMLALPLTLALGLSLAPNRAAADDTSAADWTRQRVQEGLLKPIAQLDAKRSRFSRASLPPAERRLRITADAPLRDAAGRAFVPFAVDARYGTRWQEDAIQGCAYPQNGAMYVKLGDAYRPAAFLLGRDAEPVAGVCEVPAAS
jgi:hypothetical protein